MWLLLLLGCSPTEGPVGLNELALDGVLDEADEEVAWAEVYNRTASARSLDGWTIEHAGQVWVLDAIQVDAEGLALLYLDGEPSQGETHAPFELQPSGGTVFVHDDAGELVQQIEVPSLQADTSYGRRPDGLANWQIIDSPSPGALNGE